MGDTYAQTNQRSEDDSRDMLHPACAMDQRRGHCPVCGATGKSVDTQTVKAMLAVSLVFLRFGSYHFCRTPDCSVVYFSSDGQQTFCEADVREPVYQKHRGADDVWVCYCFHHTPRTIRAEQVATGKTTVVEHITAGIHANQCACDIRNPQGDCCLGNVTVLLKRLGASSDQRAI